MVCAGKSLVLPHLVSSHGTGMGTLVFEVRMLLLQASLGCEFQYVLNTGKRSELCMVGPFILYLMVLVSFIKRRFRFPTEPLLVWKRVPVDHQSHELVRRW